MLKFIHHLLDPHCQQCREEREASKVCASCETLKDQIDFLNSERDRLLDTVIKLSTPKPAEPVQATNMADLKPITSGTIPWRVRQQMLEAEDREKARILRDKQKEIARLKPQAENINDLEKELGITEDPGGS